MQKVLIRVDSSLEIGIGHISRMLVLAHAFKVRGYAVEIAAPELEGYLDTSAMGLLLTF
jgi:spore coat polysaccharide biosynthesis predicted glycosyltransferase SpsG